MKGAAVSELPQLKGYCPVAYLVAGEPMEGAAEFSDTYQDKLYYFVTAEAKQKFRSDPEKYLPAYGGRCAFGMSIGKEFEVCPKTFKVINDKVHLFLHDENTDALALWNKEDEKKCLTNADKHWSERQTASKMFPAKI